jgi:hypothetical protein
MTVPSKLAFRIPLLLILFLLSNVSIGQATDTATFKLKSGEEYKEVKFEVNDFYKTVSIEYEGKKINLSFNDIDLVTDNKGQDVTSKVLPGYYRPQKEEWLSRESKEYKAATANPWIGLFSIGGNFSVPAGDFYDGVKSGIGFEGDFRLALNHQIAVQFIVSRSGMQLSDNIHLVSYDPYLSILNENISFHATRYEAAVNFHQPFSRVSNDKSMWYGLSGLGVITHTTTTEATVRNINTGQIGNINDSQSNSKFAFMFGFGAIKMLSKHLGLDFGFTLDWVAVSSDNNNYHSGVSYGYIFDLKLRAVAMF